MTVEKVLNDICVHYNIPDEVYKKIIYKIFCNRLPPPPPYKKRCPWFEWRLLDDSRKSSALRVLRMLCNEPRGGWEYFKTTKVKLGYEAKRTEVLDTMVYLLLNTGELKVKDNMYCDVFKNHPTLSHLYDEESGKYPKSYTKPYKKLSCKTITDMKYKFRTR